MFLYVSLNTVHICTYLLFSSCSSFTWLASTTLFLVYFTSKKQKCRNRILGTIVYCMYVHIILNALLFCPFMFEDVFGGGDNSGDWWCFWLYAAFMVVMSNIFYSEQCSWQWTMFLIVVNLLWWYFSDRTATAFIIFLGHAKDDKLPPLSLSDLQYKTAWWTPLYLGITLIPSSFTKPFPGIQGS